MGICTKRTIWLKLKQVDGAVQHACCLHMMLTWLPLIVIQIVTRPLSLFLMIHAAVAVAVVEEFEVLTGDRGSDCGLGEGPSI